MHYLVRLIVEAEDADEANSEAAIIMENLVDWHEFSSYNTQPDCSSWPGCWQPQRLSTKGAQTMVRDAMRGQFAEFKQALATIRIMLDGYSDEQIFNEELKKVDDHRLSRYQFSMASGYQANACQLYGSTGSAIINQRELDEYLKDPKSLWVVQVDCHN